jgi:hypothetical protein
MSIFKKSLAFSLCLLVVSALSAFSSQTKQSLITAKSHMAFQADNRTKSTVVATDSVQIASEAKHPKNILSTKTPKPTGTPPVIPPPADPGATNMMIGLAILPVIVILFGFWLNRRRVF